MATIAENLQTLQDTLTDIKTALTNKGVTPSDALIDVPSEIASISGSTPTLITLTAENDGTYTPGVGVDGYDEVIVDVIKHYTVYIKMTNPSNTEVYKVDDAYSNEGHIFYTYNGQSTPAESAAMQANSAYREYDIIKGGVIEPINISGKQVYVSTDDGATWSAVAGDLFVLTVLDQKVQVNSDELYVSFTYNVA